MKHEYLVMKLGHINGIDFYKEHLKVIEKYGYVDMARTGRKFLNFADLQEPYFYIKESAGGGNRLFRAQIGKSITGAKRVPDYYTKLNVSDASWVRIISLEETDKNKFLSAHTLKNGNEIKGLNQGAVSYFYIINKNENDSLT